MFEDLNIRTRGIVRRVCAGEHVELGSHRIEKLNDKEIELLRILGAHLRKLEPLRGQDLVEEVIHILNETAEAARGKADAHPAKPPEDIRAQTIEARLSLCGYKVGLLRARSFRGLAPAAVKWEYDFGGSSHLLHGPNGCGKSSLLGAISYCLTGRIFRDDRPPEVPRTEKVYSANAQGSQASERPDALALTDGAGENTDPDEEYSVELQLIGNGASEVWIRRHSKTGLSMSSDGDAWTQIESLREAGIDELDAELNVVMPARLPHIRFGKDAELLRVLSQITGLDDLEAIADVAGRLSPALRRETTRIKSKEIAPKDKEIGESLGRLAEVTDSIVTELPSYTETVGGKGTLHDVETLGRALKAAIGENMKQLASDLGIEMATGDPDRQAEYEKQLENLPGQVQTAIDELSRPLVDVFASSVGFNVAEEHLSQLEHGLAEFEETARRDVVNRLEWARKERADAKAALMLKAAAHFQDAARECPVCGQSLDRVPGVAKALIELKPLTHCPHLAANLQDVGLRLMNDLDKLVPVSLRSEGRTPLSERIRSDWLSLRAKTSKGLLQQVSTSFDRRIEAVVAQFSTEPRVVVRPLADEYGQEFPDAFTDVDSAIADAKAYVRLCRSVVQNRSSLRELLNSVLTAQKGESEEDSLQVVIERGRATNEAIKTLTIAYGLAKRLYKDVKVKEELAQKVREYEDLAGTGDTLKQFGVGVRSEVTQMVGLLDSKMREYFQLLYGNEILELHVLTTGNAANPNVKDEINTYLRAGGQLVPIGPFCNAGRFRALVLSFVFALLGQSKGSMGVTILDDPAVSLDDEHKARFIDHLVGPLLSKGQVILATHYETFYKDCQPVFSDARHLRVTPRPRCADVVSFEPGDLLERVDEVLSSATSGWKEAGGNLRVWAERTLATLSAYCPEPFVIFNNVPGSIDTYAEIQDRNVATPERDQIVAALRSAQFKRVLHKCAHDEEFTKPDVEDGLRSLESCRKAVKKEIERFKKLYSHALVARRVPSASNTPQVKIDTLRLKNMVPPWNLNVVREAAAAHNGQGIDWDENQTHCLEGYQMVLATADTLSPIVLVGQSLLLDNRETPPVNGDLVIVETMDAQRYLRRFWKSPDGSLMLVTTNPTRPRQPVHLPSGQHKMRRIVGVFFSAVNTRSQTKPEEWVPFQLSDGWSSNIVGLRIKGTSMEPFVREDQFVLVRRGESQKITGGMLGCVDIADVGTVIKRCYPSKTEWVLCSMNPNDIEDPMQVRPQDILHAYPLVGALFEL